jgi:sugar/nucleoside kinase (ribokinase family)
MYDITFLGHYTKDTIVSARGTRTVDGGAVFYGANVASRMGLKTAIVTRLAREDFRVVEEIEKLGVQVFARATPKSTCLRLEYPSSNVDERVIRVASNAGPFTPEEVEHIETRAVAIGGRCHRRLHARGDQSGGNGETRPKGGQDRRGCTEFCAYRSGRYSRFRGVAGKACSSGIAPRPQGRRGGSGIAHPKLLFEIGPREIVLTHRDGVLVYDGNQFHEAGFFPRKLVGRSGRGDTCIASYMACRLNASPAKATIWAAAVSSLKMEAEGPFRRDIAEVARLIEERY